MMEKWKKSLQILLFFCKIGCFTFGGGWSIVAQMQQEFVEKRGWITEEELLDFTSVARSLPGIMIANTSLIFGYHMAGVPGALAAVVGITIPSVVIIALVMQPDGTYEKLDKRGKVLINSQEQFCAEAKAAVPDQNPGNNQRLFIPAEPAE